MGQVEAKEARSTQTQQVSLDGIEARVVAVNIEGLQRTKNDIVMNNVKELFQVNQFQELAMTSNEVRNKLMEMGCFNKVEIEIDTSESGIKDYVVTYNVEETRRVVGSVNTMVGNNEESLTTGIQLPNCLGRGEKFQAEYSYGIRKSSMFNISLVKPLFGMFKSTLSGNVYQATGEHPTSGFKEIDRGIIGDLTFVSGPQVVHNLQYEAVWRHLNCISKSTSFSVREQSGHTLKSAVRHILNVDRRDNPIFPTEGTLFRLTHEFAGLGGNVGFFKSEADMQVNLPLAEDISLQGCFQFGLMKPVDPAEKTFTISDRFFLGGPLSIRGFDLRGVGPQDHGNALGGTNFWASGLHLYAPLPFRPGQGGFGDLFRTHLFTTAGNVGSFWLSGDVQRDIDMMTQDFRLSTGLGIALKLGGIGRVEINYCIPVKVCRGDKVNPGLQFGIGLNFL